MSIYRTKLFWLIISVQIVITVYWVYGRRVMDAPSWIDFPTSGLFIVATIASIWHGNRFEDQKDLIECGLKCGNCGYDLRASKDRCPECGTAIPTSDVTTNPQSLSDDIK